jgi:hypothetical protein
MCDAGASPTVESSFDRGFDGGIFPQTVGRLLTRKVRGCGRERSPTTYYYGVPSRKFTLDELTELVERFRPDRAGSKVPHEITESQVQLLLARIAALTEVLRSAEPGEPARLASRLALNDLAAVADQFRGRTNAMRAALAKALADVRDGPFEAPGAKGC